MPTSIKNNLSLYIFLAYIFIGYLTFSNSLNNAFMIDDHGFFFNEKTTNIKLWAQNFLPDRNKVLGVESGGTDTSYFRPFAHIIPMLCFQLFKTHPTGYHVINLILVVVAAYLIYKLIQKIFNNQLLAFLSGLFYLIHPINGFLVNYITADVYGAQMIFMTACIFFFWQSAEIYIKNNYEQYKNIEKTKDCHCERRFWLLAKQSLIRLLRHLRLPVGSQVPRNDSWRFFKNSNFVLTIIFFILSLLCHETSLVLPIYLIVLLLVVKKNSMAQALKSTWPLLLISVLYFLLRLKFASLNNSIFHNIDKHHMNFFEFFASLLKLSSWYLSKFFYPEGIVFMWATPVVREGAWLWILAGLIFVSGIIFYFFRNKKQSAIIQLGCLWIIIGFIPLIPGSIVTPLMGVFIEPHWFTFSSLGMFLIFAACFNKVFQKISKKLGILIIIFISISWMMISRQYNELWGNEKKYCEFMLQQTPNFKAPAYFLAKYYEKERNWELARKYYQQSLLGRYKDWMVYLSLASLDLKENKIDDARKNFLACLQLEPRSSAALNGLGVVYLKKNDKLKAIKLFEMAVDADRYSIQARINLATTLFSAGKNQEAVATIKKGLEFKPNDEPLLVALIKIYISSKDDSRILETTREIVAISSNPESLTNSANILWYYKHLNEAKAALNKALAIDPQFKPAQTGLKILSTVAEKKPIKK